MPARMGEAERLAAAVLSAINCGGDQGLRANEGTRRAGAPEGESRHRRDQRPIWPDRHLARADRLFDQQRQCHEPPFPRRQFQCLARSPVVHVRRHGDARRAAHAQGRRTRAGRSDLLHGLRTHADLDRHHRRRSVSPADLRDPCLFHLAVFRRFLAHRRDLLERRRTHPVAGQAHSAGRLRTHGAAGGVGNHQALRCAGRHLSSGISLRETPAMIAFLKDNLAPLMFLGLILFMLIGYPAAFSLAAVGLFFAFIGIELGMIEPNFLGNLTYQLFGIVSNELLLAIPFFTFMGAILERCGLAEDLLDSIGQLFGPIRGGLSYAVIFVGAILGAITGTVAASVIAMGVIAIPAMIRTGYSTSHTMGVIAASGTITQLIPPSLVLVVLADQLGRSVGDMYAGAIGPSLIQVLLFCA